MVTKDFLIRMAGIGPDGKAKGIELDKDGNLKVSLNSGIVNKTNNRSIRDNLVDNYKATLINVNEKSGSIHTRLRAYRDGKLYVGDSHYIRVSEDDGETWQQLTTADDIPTLRQIVPTDDGELLIVSVNGQLWRSKNGITEWEQVLPSIGGTGFQDGNVDKYGNIILVGNYGSGLDYLNVWMSSDDGKTWDTIFHDDLPGVNWNHVHDVRFDPYENLIWFCMGDSYGGYEAEENRVYMSPDYGQTWVYKKGIRATSIIPMPDCVLFLGDEQGRSSIFRYDRIEKGSHTIRATAHPVSDVQGHMTHVDDWKIDEVYFVSIYPDEVGTSLSWGTIASVTFGKSAEAYFGYRPNANNPHPLTIIGTKDGYTFHRIWRSEEVYSSGYGIGGVFGPDENGRLFAAANLKNDDGELNNYIIILTPERTDS